MIAIKVIVLAMILMAFTTGETMKPYVNSYIDQYKYMAIDEMERSGIPASITMAQAILESNAGVSQLARESNNHFGIKCKSYWEGMSYYHPDDDRDSKGNIIPSCFRKYPTVKDSYEDHSTFLMNTDHYQCLFSYGRRQYKLWAEGLERCGYATDKRYAEKLIQTIELYNLDELDLYTVKYVERSQLDTLKNMEIAID